MYISDILLRGWEIGEANLIAHLESHSIFPIFVIVNYILHLLWYLPFLWQFTTIIGIIHILIFINFGRVNTFPVALCLNIFDFLCNIALTYALLIEKTSYICIRCNCSLIPFFLSFWPWIKELFSHSFQSCFVYWLLLWKASYCFIIERIYLPILPT